MTRSFPRRRVVAPPVLVLLCLAVASGVSAERGSVLNPASHEGIQPYRSDFDTSMVDMSARLPWKERFTPEGAFDAAYKLDAVAPAVAPAEDEGMDVATDGYGTTGVVEDVRRSSGKLKIAHGPIENLGMPAMTMLFSVADEAMLDGLEANDPVEFDVENQAAGFVITRLRRTGGGQ